jgi:hypothetical protein
MQMLLKHYQNFKLDADHHKRREKIEFCTKGNNYMAKCRIYLLFIYDLFNDVVSSSDQTTQHCWERWWLSIVLRKIGKEAVES